MYFTLQEQSPYESCLLWHLHQHYYQNQGLQAFLKQEVPYNVSSNPCYAMDCVQIYLTSTSGESAHSILEIGAGLGLFALNFLQALQKQAPEKLDTLCYWLSDYSMQGLQDLSAHPAFIPWLESGHLKLCRLDVLNPETIRDPWGHALELPASGFEMILANYVFSTLPTAVLMRRGEQWQRQMTTLECWPLGPNPSPESVKLYRLAISQALQADRFIEQIPLEHPNYHVFKALDQAQKHVAHMLIEAEIDSQLNIKDWLEKHLAHHWAKNLGQNTEDPEQQALLLQSIRSIISEPLFQITPTPTVEPDSIKEIHGFENVHLESVCPDPVHQKAIEDLTKSSLVASVGYSASALQTIEHSQKLLTPNGVLLISDKAYADASWMLSDQAERASRHGQSLAHPVNFPLIEAIAQKQGHSVLRTHNPTQALHHLLISAASLPSALHQTFEQRFLTFPGNEISHALLEGGHALMQNEALEQAARCFERALSFRPTDGTLQYFYAVCLLNQGHYQRAKEILETEHDDYFGILNRDVLLGEIYRFFEDYPQAIDSYQASFRHGKNSQTYFNLALCWIELHDIQQAIACLTSALELDPDDTETRDLLNEIHP